DAAVMLVLKPLGAAEAAGDPVLATIDTAPADSGAAGALVTSRLLGHAHSAAGLLEIAAIALAVERGARLDAGSMRLVPQLGAQREAALEQVVAPAQATSFATVVTLRRVNVQPRSP